MCIRRETREKARQILAFSRVSKPHTHITHMLRQCTIIVYILQCQKAYTVLYFNVRKLILFYTSMSESLYCSLLLALHETLCL
jgi:hypothetical protein